MSYRVKKDGVTVPREVTERKSAYDPTKTTKLYESKVYSEGDVIPDKDVAQVIVDKLNDGDEHVSNLLEKVTSTKKNKK